MNIIIALSLLPPCFSWQYVGTDRGCYPSPWGPGQVFGQLSELGVVQAAAVDPDPCERPLEAPGEESMLDAVHLRADVITLKYSLD